METTLQQLYNGSLCPQAGGGKNPGQYPNNYGQFIQSREKFGRLLEDQAPGLVTKFNVLMDDLALFYVNDTEELFYQGFGLAVKLFSEALAL